MTRSNMFFAVASVSLFAFSPASASSTAPADVPASAINYGGGWVEELRCVSEQVQSGLAFGTAIKSCRARLADSIGASPAERPGVSPRVTR